MDAELLDEAGFAEVQTFLREIYGPDEPRKLTDEFWRWKCTLPHPLWCTSRGFIRRKEARIVAYASLIPLRFLTPFGPVNSGHVVDWAALRGIPGAGVRLYRHIQSLTGSVIGIGGSKETRQILPRIGAALRQTVTTYQRPARPFRAALQGRKDWKWPARLLRDLRYACSPLPAVPPHWKAEHVSRFDTSLDTCLATPLPDAIRSERGSALLNYWLECPAARMAGYLIRSQGETIGYFLTSSVPNTARIADIWVRISSVDQWMAAYGLAFRTATQSDVLTVETMTSHPSAREALDRMGLRRSDNQVFLLDPSDALPVHLPLALFPVDFDGFYL